MNQLEADDLIMIEPVVKQPFLRAQKVPKDRMYLWFHRGEKIKLNETMLADRLKDIKMVCSVDLLIMRLYNTHSLVINTKTGEVFDGSAAVA